MPDLLCKPFGTHGKVHEITPARAGWRHVGFSLYRLRPGETIWGDTVTMYQSFGCEPEPNC